jgi:hypothetical protein
MFGFYFKKRHASIIGAAGKPHAISVNNDSHWKHDIAFVMRALIPLQQWQITDFTRLNQRLLANRNYFERRYWLHQAAATVVPPRNWRWKRVQPAVKEAE